MDVALRRLAGPARIMLFGALAAVLCLNGCERTIAALRTPTYVLRIAETPPNWRPAAQEVGIAAEGDALLIRSAKTPGGYQLFTDTFRTARGRPYKVGYALDVTSGTLAIGIINAHTASWMALRAVTSGTGAIDFRAQSDSAAVIIAVNEPDGHFVARLTKLVVFRGRPG